MPNLAHKSPPENRPLSPDEPESDASLARRAAAGDDDAFEEIVQRHSRLVYNLILRSVRSPEDADDLTQETFLKAWRSLSSFRGDCALTSWLCRIALNCTVDYARAAKRHLTLPLTVQDDDGDETSLDLPATDVSSLPEEALARKENIDAVRHAIDALPEDARVILTMRDITGLSYAEISEILRLEMGTVKSRLNRARASLKNLLIHGNLFP